MEFEYPLIEGTFIKRYKRFFVDVRLANGDIVTSHCPNTGSMKTCALPDHPVMLSPANNPKRKLAYTLEMLHNHRCWIGLNPAKANMFVAEALRTQHIAELRGYTDIKAEVKIDPETRLDFCLRRENHPHCYVEVKSVSMIDEEGHYSFPDAVTTRGLKHIKSLEALRDAGHRAVLLFVIQRSDGDLLRPAWEIDPLYSETLKAAQLRGLEVLAYNTAISPMAITLDAPVAIALDRH